MIGPFEIFRSDGQTFTVLVDGLSDTVSSDHVTWTPPPTGQEPNVDGWTIPDAVVRDGHAPDGPAFLSDRFFTYDVDHNGDIWLNVRWWGYGPEEDAWERVRKLDPRKVRQDYRRKRLPTLVDWRPS